MDQDILRFKCPHCGDMCAVCHVDIKCRILRHAVHASIMVPHNSHAFQKDLDIASIMGCGKPFFIDSQDCPVPCHYR
jgi:hypothetical protein